MKFLEMISVHPLNEEHISATITPYPDGLNDPEERGAYFSYPMQKGVYIQSSGGWIISGLAREWCLGS